MKRTRIILLMALIFSTTKASAQSKWDIEIDPLAYLFKGFSFHGGYQQKNIRYDLGIFGLEEPTSLHKQEDFRHRGIGAGVKSDYLFKSYKGPFAGLSASAAVHTYTYLPEDTDVERFELTTTVRSGYRFMIGKHFTIVPWGDIGYVLNDPAAVTVSGASFHTDRFKYFLTVHLGWKF